MTLIEQAEAMAERLEHELGWGIGPAMLCQEAAALIRRMADELRKAGEYVEIERLGRG